MISKQFRPKDHGLLGTLKADREPARLRGRKEVQLHQEIEERCLSRLVLGSF